MSGSREEQVKALFEEVSELPADQHDQFLQERCPPGLRPELETLLGHDAVPKGAFLEGQDDPKQINQYRIERRIGEGGMGIVYLAERQKPIQSKVALKVTRLGMNTREVIARFDSERQALALMNHPNIAIVHDAGATEKGNPYFVMEYIPGKPITTYCDEHRLTLGQRLALFMQVCDAIQHAHQKGIMHRDIKPTNVLVADGDGVPVVKVIDFGIAKATSQRLTEHTQFTQHGRIIGTLGYISPEQADGKYLDVDTRTDVYSLGVLLYELLIGTQPFDERMLREAGWEEMQRIIRETDPPTPSMRLTSVHNDSSAIAEKRQIEPKALLRRLRGDLDWIVMKCLEKDRARRYATPNALTEDIQRYLKHEPVSAGPPSTVYRLKKFVKRNRGRVVAALLVGLVLTTGFITITVMYSREEARRREAEVQRKRADEQTAIAIQVREFIVNIFEQIDPEHPGPNSVTAHELLDNAARTLALRRDLNAIVEAPLRDALGRAYMGLGEFANAAVQFRYALNKLETTNDLAATAATSEVLGSTLCKQGDFAEAEANFARASSIWLTLQRQDAPGDDTMVAEAQCLLRRENFAQAEPLLLRALDIRRAALGDRHAKIAECLSGLGEVEWYRNNPKEAKSLFQQACHMYSQFLGDDAPATWMCRANLAQCLETDEFDEKIRLLQETVERSRRRFGNEHYQTASALAALSDTFRENQRYSEALPLEIEALGIRRRIFGNQNEETLGSINDLFTLEGQLGHFEEAEALCRELVLGYIATKPPENWWIIFAKQGLGRSLLLQSKKLDEAAELFREIIEIRGRRFYFPDRPARAVEERVSDIKDLIITLTDMDSLDDAEHEARDLLEFSTREYGANSGEEGIAMALLGRILVKQGDCASAQPFLRKALDLTSSYQEALSRLQPWVSNALGGCVAMAGEFQEAERLLVGDTEVLWKSWRMTPAHRREATGRIVLYYERVGDVDAASHWREKLEQ